jgi:hypothetical protein
LQELSQQLASRVLSPQPASRLAPFLLPASLRPVSFLQPLVNLLDLHQVCNGAHIPAVGGRIFTDDRIANPLQTQTANGVTHVGLFADQ